MARQRPRQGPGYTDGRRLAPCQQSPGGFLRRAAPLSLRHQHLRQLRMAARQVECLRQRRPPALEDLHLHARGSGGIPWQGQPLHLQPQLGGRRMRHLLRLQRGGHRTKHPQQLLLLGRRQLQSPQCCRLRLGQPGHDGQHALAAQRLLGRPQGGHGGVGAHHTHPLCAQALRLQGRAKRLTGRRHQHDGPTLLCRGLHQRRQHQLPFMQACQGLQHLAQGSHRPATARQLGIQRGIPRGQHTLRAGPQRVGMPHPSNGGGQMGRKPQGRAWRRHGGKGIQATRIL